MMVLTPETATVPPSLIHQFTSSSHPRGTPITTAIPKAQSKANSIHTYIIQHLIEPSPNLISKSFCNRHHGRGEASVAGHKTETPEITFSRITEQKALSAGGFQAVVVTDQLVDGLN